MDAKKRVAVPASWLSGEEGQTFYVIPHPTEGYLMVMPLSEFNRQEQAIKDSPAAPADKRRAIRQFFGEAHTTATDKQGRILLNEKHCERAGLSGEIVFGGGGRRFEIWSRDRHAASEPERNDALALVAEMTGM